MDNGHRTRELLASGASEGAPYGRMLPPERDGLWMEGGCVRRDLGERAQARGDMGAAYVRGLQRVVERKPRPDAGLGPNVRALGVLKQNRFLASILSRSLWSCLVSLGSISIPPTGLGFLLESAGGNAPKNKFRCSERRANPV